MQSDDSIVLPILIKHVVYQIFPSGSSAVKLLVSQNVRSPATTHKVLDEVMGVAGIPG